MKNLKKLSRSEMKMKIGGAGPYEESFETADGGGQWCHFHYTGTLWGNNMVITADHSGSCPKGAPKCYSYFATGSC